MTNQTMSFQDRTELEVAVNSSEDTLLGLIETFVSTKKLDPRWAAIARTDLEKGFDALRRALNGGKRL